MTDKARELLERALESLRAEYGSDPLKLEKEIMAWLLEPEVPFVRLTEEEVNSLTYAPLEPYELICAVENRLAEKNK